MARSVPSNQVNCEPIATFAAQSPKITAHNVLETAKGWMDYFKCDYRHYLIIHENIWQYSLLSSDVAERLNAYFRIFS